MFLELIDEIINCFESAINSVQAPSTQISPPVCKEDDEAEMLPLFEDGFDIDYLDEVPF